LRRFTAALHDGRMALEGLAERLLKMPITEWKKPDPEDYPYCDGALRLQHHHTASVECVASRDANGFGFTCNDCGLDLKDFELPQTAWSDVEWTRVAKYHMMASLSMEDRRAWYKCPICNELGDDAQIVLAARQFLAHLDGHGTLLEYRSNLRKMNEQVTLR
jgi:hypothetical protein